MPRLLVLLLAVGLALAQEVATLAKIEANPEAYYGRELWLLGYLWPWFEPAPLLCEGLPLAGGNVAKTRSDPNFCDGTRIAFVAELPDDVPKGKGPWQVRARVEPAPGGGWYLVVLELR